MKNLKTFLLCVAGSWCVGAAAAEVRISTPVQILGAEAYCASWSAGVDANGDATLTCVPVSGWNGTCPGFSNTLVLQMNWSNPQRLYTANIGAGFGPNDVAVVVFTTGSVPSPSSSLARIVAAEYQTGPSTRQATLSDKPCDFGTQAFAGATTSGTTVSVPFTVNDPNNYGYYPILNLNTTYYFNIRNAPDPSCAGTGNCNIAVDLQKPGGL